MKKMHTMPVIFTGTAPTKSEINNQCQEIINRINDSGEVNPLKVATAMKALETAMKIIKAGITDAVLEEAEKHNAKTFDFDGHQLQVRQAGVKYDYSNCNDPEHERLQQQMEELKEQIKKREDWLKSAPEDQTILDEETGEVHKIYPPAKSGTTSVSITLAK